MDPQERRQSQDDFEESVKTLQTRQKEFQQKLAEIRSERLLTQIKAEYLVPGSRWANQENPAWVLSVEEVFPSRVRGVCPDGHSFRCSAGVFLRKYFPVDPDILDEMILRVTKLAKQPGPTL